MYDYLWWAAYFTLAMFTSALNAKALGATIAFCIGLLCLYPEADKAALLILFYIPAVVLANFRD